MPRKKTAVTEAEQEEIRSVQRTFRKEQILAASKYRNRRDLVDALLDDDKSYTIKEVEDKINNYKKGQMK